MVGPNRAHFVSREQTRLVPSVASQSDARGAEDSPDAPSRLLQMLHANLPKTSEHGGEPEVVVSSQHLHPSHSYCLFFEMW